MTGSDLGRAGFIVAIVAVVLAVAQQLFFSFLPYFLAGYPIFSYATLSAIVGIVHAAVCAVALVLGILGAQRRRSPVLSGIAIGVGGAGVIAAVIGIVVIPFVGVLL